MSRIRSIHPGQWTDEDFVECSLAARLLNLGIRNEADDNGIFEWRPMRLKMRLFPVDALDVAELLEELEARGLVLRYEAEGRTYGAIRNFRVYQNPRSPKAEHPIIPAAEAFVGDRAGEESAEKRGPGRPRKQPSAENNSADAKSFPQNVENNSERERRGEKKDISPSDSSISAPLGESSEPHEAAALVLVHSARDPVDEAFDAFQALRAELVPGARPLKLDPDRRQKLAKQLREIGGAGGWEQVLARIRGSPFLRGETARGGKLVAEIDWLLKPHNLRKVLEGNYDDGTRDHHPAAKRVVRASPIDALAEARIAAQLV